MYCKKVIYNKICQKISIVGKIFKYQYMNFENFKLVAKMKIIK